MQSALVVPANRKNALILKEIIIIFISSPPKFSTLYALKLINFHTSCIHWVGHSSLPLLELSFKTATSFHCHTSIIPPGVRLSKIKFAPSCYMSSLPCFSTACVGAQTLETLCTSLHLCFLLFLPEWLALSFCSCLVHSVYGSSCLLIYIFLAISR